MPVCIKCQHHRCRDHQSEAGIRAEQETNHNWQRNITGQSDHQQGRCENKETDNSHCDHPLHPEPVAQCRGELGGTEETRCVDRKGQTELHRRQPELLGIDKGRAGDEDKETRHAETTDEGQSEEHPVAQQNLHAMHHVADIDRHSIRLRQRLGQREPDQQQADDRPAGEHQKDRMPVPGQDQKTSGQRRQHRRDTDDQHDRRHQAGCLRPGIQVTHNGARHHHDNSRTHALQKPAGDKPFNRRRQHTAQRSGNKDQQPDIKRQLPANLIRPWAIQHLRRTEGNEEGRQGDLHTGDSCPEICCNCRQGRQIHINRERPDAGQQTKNGCCSVKT